MKVAILNEYDNGTIIQIRHEFTDLCLICNKHQYKYSGTIITKYENHESDMIKLEREEQLHQN